jgi:site-specific DNA-methyltransferase (adenine-specific)
MLDEQSEERPSGGKPAGERAGRSGGIMGRPVRIQTNHAFDSSTGGASRYFYTAKANSTERSQGLGGRNNHPTVKPVDLMAWLIRLVTPPGGIVLDPFLGSGTTAIAAQGAGFRWIGIEREQSYAEIAVARVGMFARLVEFAQIDQPA